MANTPPPHIYNKVKSNDWEVINLFAPEQIELLFSPQHDIFLLW